MLSNDDGDDSSGGFKLAPPPSTMKPPRRPHSEEDGGRLTRQNAIRNPEDYGGGGGYTLTRQHSVDLPIFQKQFQNIDVLGDGQFGQVLRCLNKVRKRRGHRWTDGRTEGIVCT